MAVVGSQLFGGTGSWVTVNSGGANQRAYVLGSFVMPAAGFMTRLGCWARRQGNSGNPQVWLGIYAVSSAGEPTTLLGYTARLPVGNNGQDTSGSIIWAHPSLGGVGPGVRLAAGQRFALAVKVEKQNVEFASLGVSVLHYRRSVGALNTPPTDPFSADSASAEFAYAAYGEWTENVAPTATLSLPANGGALNTQTPTFVVQFADGNSGAPSNDRMRLYAIEVSKAATGEVVWGGDAAVFPATAAERTAMATSRVYAGPTLLSDGTVYQWRARVADDTGAWSPWTAYRTFTINPLGQTDTATDGTPNSKIDTASSLIDWTGRWFHPTALATNRVQVRILRDSNVFRLGAEVVKTVASAALPGTLFTVQDTEAGIGALPGGEYTYQARGRASDGQWSPWSEPGRAFAVNRVPTTPSNLQPPNGAASSSLPLLEWNVDDLDTDDAFGVDGDSEIQIVRPNGTTATVTTNTYDPLTGKGSFQLTVTELSAFGDYRWRVRGRDTSAGMAGYGEWSAYQLLSYFSGPLVTITNPTNLEVEATSVPVVAASISSGSIARFEVRIYAQDARLPLRTSGQVTLTPAAASFTYQIPVGWLRNQGDYDLEVLVWNTLNQPGTSLRRPFTVQYGAALAPTGYQASPVMERRDYDQSPSAVLLAWDPTQYSPGEFGGYNIYRRKATEDASAMTLLRTLTAPGQTRWRDHWVQSNTLMIYGLSQLRRVGADLIESDILEATTELELAVPILNSALDPSIRFPMMHLSTDYAGQAERPETAYVTWGSNNKEIVFSAPVEAETRVIDFSVVIKGDQRGTLYDHLADLEELIKCGHPLLFRPERPQETMYCKLKKPKWKRGSVVGTRVFSGQLREIAFVPGSQGGS